MGRPVAASQSRAVPSAPVRMVLPSGLNATDQMAVMRQGRTDGLARGGVPEPQYLDLVVLGPRQHGLPVWAGNGQRLT